MLVVRGWAPEPDAALLAATGTADVTGWLQAPEGSLVTDDDPSDDVFPEIRVADAVQRVDVDLYSAYLVSQEPAAGLQAAELEALPEPEPLHRRPQPALRRRVVGLRRLRGVHLVALAPRRRHRGLDPLPPTTRRIGWRPCARNLTAYRVLATVVGVLLWRSACRRPARQLRRPAHVRYLRQHAGLGDDRSDVKELGEMITTYLWVAHGGST